MKSILVTAVLLASASAFAGWGAIAYNPQTGQVAASQGYTFYSDAVNNALSACQNTYPYASCQLMNWENNECIALAAGGGRWGRAQGFAYDLYGAQNAALNACGNPECVLLRSVCN